MHIVQNIWWLLVLIGVMILIHELGHYWAARFFDVRVDAFSFGFGPRLFGFRRGETDFRFSLILFGGYVKMAGEQPGEEASDPRAFLAKPRWQADGQIVAVILGRQHDTPALLVGLSQRDLALVDRVGDSHRLCEKQPDDGGAQHAAPELLVVADRKRVE